MRSKVNTLADYKKAPFERKITIRCPEEHIQKKLKALTRVGKQTVPAETVQKGDTVVLALVSELPRFNRPMVPVAVGSGLYDAELEAQLLGHAAGDAFEAQVQGKPVAVTVKQASRVVFPEPDDAMAAKYAEKEGIEGVKTLADFRRWAIGEYCKEKREEAHYGAMQACMDYVVANSDWDFDETEISQFVAEELDYHRQMLKEEENLDFDTAGDADLKRFYGVENREQLMAMFRQGAEHRAAMSLVLIAAHGLNAAETTQEQVDSLNWKFLEDYVSGELTFTEE